MYLNSNPISQLHLRKQGVPNFPATSLKFLFHLLKDSVGTILNIMVDPNKKVLVLTQLMTSLSNNKMMVSPPQFCKIPQND